MWRQMRPKARGLAQHGGPPGWLEESDPILYVIDAGLFRTVPVALTGAAQLRADGILVAVKKQMYTTIRHELYMSRMGGMAWYSSEPIPTLRWRHC
jgi:hypothetical protein